MQSENYAGKLKNSLFWWLSSKRSFFINDEYKIELLYIDREHNSAKIRVTNLKSNDIVEILNQDSLVKQESIND
jgi:hypothetical protein